MKYGLPCTVYAIRAIASESATSRPRPTQLSPLSSICSATVSGAPALGVIVTVTPAAVDAGSSSRIASLKYKPTVLDLPNADHSTVASNRTYAQSLMAFVGTP